MPRQVYKVITLILPKSIPFSFFFANKCSADLPPCESLFLAAGGLVSQLQQSAEREWRARRDFLTLGDGPGLLLNCLMLSIISFLPPIDCCDY